jgi:hypothetical protein
MTCDPGWPEIQSELLPGQDFTDAPVVVMRVFHRKLSLLLRTLKTMFPHAGKPVYVVYSVEFQKRGLPHAHILVRYPFDCSSPADIDRIVSAELPEDPADLDLVKKHMIHRHSANYCQRDGKCRFHYPFPVSTETNFEPSGKVLYRRRHRADEYVVPHCLALLKEFRCHINFEVASTSHIFQYLFKYVHKGKPICRNTS